MKRILFFSVVFLSGIGICFSQTDFFNKILEKAKAGDSEAQTLVAAEYVLGNHAVPRNYKKAFEWFEKAAKQGNSDAQCQLGIFYYRGLGITKNFKKAFKWFKTATEKEWYKDEHPEGVRRAQFYVGEMYYKGLGVTKNFEKAYYWSRKRHDDKIAQCRLGNMLRVGQGVQKDYKEALKWYKLSAEQGWAEAQYNLGKMYYEGEGVPVNYI